MIRESPVEVSVKKLGDKVLLEFSLKRPILPSELGDVLRAFPEIHGNVKLLISGRAPIWMYCALVHEYMHVVPVVAVYDPKVGGFVVVVSHRPDVSVGEVIKESEVGG